MSDTKLVSSGTQPVLDSMTNGVEKYMASYSKRNTIDELLNILNAIDREAYVDTIKNFRTPSNKDDLLEFIEYAVPLSMQSASDATDVEIKKAWRIKSYEAISKGLLLFKNDFATIEIIKTYQKQLGYYKIKVLIIILIAVVAWIGVMFFCINFAESI